MFLGIDQSLTSTGLCLMFDEGLYEITRTGSDKIKGVKRLQLILDDMYKFIDGRDVELAAMEGYAYGPQAGRSFNLGELGGVIKLKLTEWGIPFIIVPPTSLKLFTAGNGRADKVAMGVALFKHFGVQFEKDDEADAFALARVARAYHLDEFSNKAEARVLNDLQLDPQAVKSKKSKKKGADDGDED